MKKIAFIYTWPNNPFKNAEYEVLKRVELAAKNIGRHVDIISSNGFILDEEYYETSQRVNESDYEFMVSVHYDDIKKLDIFSYYTLWVPPEISLQYSVYPQIKKNILSNDDFLIYDDGGQLDHLKTILMDSPRNLENHSELYATPPLSAVLPPKLDNPHLFYCGINWEKLIGAPARHAGLFALLEKEEWVDIWGPQSTWEGCQRYKGVIPFDGVSMLKEINDSGVCLVISSDVHYRAGSVTNRVYEAVAGGAVVISDTNRWVQKIFGDSVLYFDFDKKNPKNMFAQIKRHMEWIRTHKKEALALAKKAQQIFIQKLGMEDQLRNIIANHAKREQAVAQALYSRCPETKTLAVSFFDELTWSHKAKERLDNLLGSVSRQIDKNIQLVLVCNKTLEANIRKAAVGYTAQPEIYPVAFYDNIGNKILTRGVAFHKVINQFKHDYLLLLDGDEYLFKDHVTTLKRVLEDTPAASMAYSGFLYVDNNGKFGFPRFEIFRDAYIRDFFRLKPSGCFLFKQQVENYIPSYAYSNLDGAELYALVNVAYFKHQAIMAFSKRLTARKQHGIEDYSNPALPIYEQVNMVNGINLFELEKIDFNNLSTGLSSSNSLFTHKFYKRIASFYCIGLNLLIVLHSIRKIFAVGKKKHWRVKMRIQSFKLERQHIKDIAAKL